MTSLTSLIMSSSSACVGFCPNDLITVPSSLVVIVPSPSTLQRISRILVIIRVLITFVEEGECLFELCNTMSDMGVKYMLSQKTYQRSAL
jgi:hypothetical protein